MSRWTPWTWSQPHGRHYSYLLAADGTVLDTLWSGHPATTAGSTSTEPVNAATNSTPRYPQTTTLPPQTNTLISQGSPPRRNYTTDRETYQPGSNVEDDENEEEDEAEQRNAARVKSPRSIVYTSTNLLNVSSSYSSNPQRYVVAPSYKNPHGGQYTNNFDASSSSWQHTPLHNAQVIQTQAPRPIESLPAEVQAHMGYLDRRFIQTGPDQNNAEQLDSREYRRTP